MTNMIRAALLAHQQEGSIRFEIEDAKSRVCMSSDFLVVVPTGKIGGVAAGHTGSAPRA